MVWPRFVLSAVVLIVTNLIVGSISLSLSLIAAVMLVGVLVVALVLLTLLGLCVALEKMNWLSAGWTDTRIERLKGWARRTWRGMPSWYREQKRRTIEMLVATLKDKEAPREQGAVKVLKSSVVALVILLAIVLVKYSFHLSVGWSIAIVGVGCVIAAIPIVYVQSRASSREPVETDRDSLPVGLPASAVDAGTDELTAALKELVALHRAGRLTELLQAPRSGYEAPTLRQKDGTDEVGG